MPFGSAPQPTESLLVFSDVHLGSDLQEAAAAVIRRSSAVDRDLVRFLAHYRREPVPADRWRIVIAGDFIDFIGMTLSPERAGALETAPNEEELRHGVGSAADHARYKLRRVAERHADVFDELARFLLEGHALSIVHGNHDIELYWNEVQDEFCEVLLARARMTGIAFDEVELKSRVEFNPWFFWRDGVVYIEHGHQYDPFCSTEHVMAPLSPLDPRRVARGFTDVLLRFVVRQTRGLKEHGHETMGAIDYLTFGLRLGISGTVALARQFVRAVVELFRLRRAHLSDAARALRAQHDARVAELAHKTRVGMDRLRALLALQAAPVTTSVRAILGSLLLDRLALAFLAAVTIGVLVLLGALHGLSVLAIASVVAVWMLLHKWLSRQRSVDPAAVMADRAVQLAKLFPAAFVVMGHTHVPVSQAVGDARYINVGSWAEEEPEADGTSPRAARTHLVIHMRGDGPEAHLCVWDESGPREI